MAESSRRVLIAGYYGFGNSGDEAILAGTLQDLRALRPGLDCIVVSGNPGETAARFGVHAIATTDLPAILEAGRQADLVLLGGGGVFHDYWGADPDTVLTRRHGGIPFYAGFPLLAALTDTPCMLYGVGVGPLLTDEGKRLTRTAFELASVATVRDPESRDIVRSLGVSAARVHVTADPAFRLHPDRLRGRAIIADSGLGTGDPLVAVCLRNWDVEVSPDAWQGQVAAALDDFVGRHSVQLVFVPLQHWPGHPLTDDVAVAEAVLGRMRRSDRARLLPEPYGPAEVAGILGACELVLGMRLHALVFALQSGVPPVALSYDPKVRSLMARLGLEADCVDVRQVTSAGLAATLDRAWAARREAGPVLAARACDLAAQAAENSRRAVELLDGGASGPMADSALPIVRDFALRQASRLAAKEEAFDVAAAELTRLRGELTAMTGSAAWVLAARLQGLRASWVPPGGTGDRVARAIGRVVRAAASHGLRGLVRAVAGEIGKGARLVIWEPRGLFAARYVEENNAQVTLYTDDPRVCPGYEPRRSLIGLGKKPLAVSLIATVRNEADGVPRWFDGFVQQSRPPGEVIVVDGGSTDGTLERLRVLAAASPVPFTVISEPGANIARGRNLAIARACGPVVAATDFGCRLRPTWLEALVAPLENDVDIQVVAGWYQAVADGRPARRRRWPTLARVRPESFLPSSRSIAFTKEAWETVGGYPEWLTLTGEDTYFALELQRSCPRWAFVPEAVVEWEAPARFTDYLRKIYSWSIGDGEAGVRAVHYWTTLLRLGASAAGGLAIAGGLVGLWLGASPGLAGALLLAGAALVALLGRRPRSWNPSELATDVAAIMGFVRGAWRAPVVTARRGGELRGLVVVLSGVPIDDTGGGSRAAQLALELLRQRYAVLFVSRFPRYETAQLDLRIRHPNLVTQRLADFDWSAFRRTHAPFFQDSALATIVEFPLAEFLPAIRATHADGAMVVYDLLDDWQTTLGADWYSPATEMTIVAESQVLIATAETLVERLETASGRPVALLPNAVNDRLFRRRSQPRPADLPAAAWTVMYVGALWGSWFDWKLFMAIATRYPEAAVVAIGDYREQCVRPPANLHFLGLKPQRELPGYLSHATVAVIPWRLNAIARGTSPLKVYEYLAMGRPVVAPDLPTLRGVPFVLRSRDRTEFLENVGRARDLRVEGETLDAFLRHNSWTARVERLVALIGTHAPPGSPWAPRESAPEHSR